MIALIRYKTDGRYLSVDHGMDREPRHGKWAENNCIPRPVSFHSDTRGHCMGIESQRHFGTSADTLRHQITGPKCLGPEMSRYRTVQRNVSSKFSVQFSTVAYYANFCIELMPTR